MSRGFTEELNNERTSNVHPDAVYIVADIGLVPWHPDTNLVTDERHLSKYLIDLDAIFGREDLPSYSPESNPSWKTGLR